MHDARSQGLKQLYAETRALELITSAARFNLGGTAKESAQRTMLVRQVEELGEMARDVAWRLRSLDLQVPADLSELAGLSKLVAEDTSFRVLASAREQIMVTAEALASAAGTDKRTGLMAMEQAQTHRRTAQLLRALLKATAVPRSPGKTHLGGARALP